MRSLRLASLGLVFTCAAACGGKVDEPSATVTPGSNAATNTPATGEGCDLACNRLHDCTSPPDDLDACVRSCERNLSDPLEARIYGNCIASTSCATIRAGQFLDFGPIGECYSKAHQR